MPKPNERDKITTQLRARLLVLRNMHQLTDTAWARAAHVRQQDVSRFTTGRMTYPRLDFLDALCRVFQITLADALAPDLPKPSLTRAQQELLINVAAMEPSFRHAVERLTAPRRVRRRDGSR